MRRSLIAFAIVMGSYVFTASGAFADGFFHQPAVYGGLGYAKTHFNDDGQFDGLTADTRDKGLHVFGGYQFNPYFAVEVSTRDLGEYGAQGYDAVYREEFAATTIGAVGFLPLGSGFSLYGRIGAGAIALDEKVSYAGGHDSDDDAGGVSTLGAGVEYRNSGLALRLGWESHFFTVETAQVFTAGNYAYIDEDEYDQRIDSFGFDIAYYFSL